MAYEIIHSQKIAEFEQEELLEREFVFNPNTGDTDEIITVTQVYAHVWTELIIKQKIFTDLNTSNFLFEFWVHATAGELGDGFSIEGSTYMSSLYVKGTEGVASKARYIERQDYDRDTIKQTVKVNPGETISVITESLELGREKTPGLWGIKISGEAVDYSSVYSYHDINGILQHFGAYRYTVKLLDFNFSGDFSCYIKNLLVNGSIVERKTLSGDYDVAPTPLPINRSTYPITANNFTDEENPSFTYAVTTSKTWIPRKKANGSNSYTNEDQQGIPDRVISVQAALSFDGETADIDYRDIPIDGTSYTFNLTEAERELLRVKAQGSDTVPIYYLTKTIRAVGGEDQPSRAGTYPLYTGEHVCATQRFLTVVDCNPTLNPTVKDIKPETLVLTGDENTFVRYESMAEYAINATASKQATIVSQSVQCGSKTVSNLPQGIIDDTESADFIFKVVDSRGLQAQTVLQKNLIEYVKPTCYQALEIGFSSDVGVQIKVTVNGNYYNGSFGAADNELTLEVRYAEKDAEMGEWITLTGTPTFNGNTYKLEATFSGFTYEKAYVFQCRATDKLNVVESSQYTIKLMPTFDWSETDFNFNVPVNINAETLDINGETVLRHNAANNTVLSANGGNIYIRPNGTNNTSGETIIYPDGSVKFGGAVDFDSFTIEGNTLADYITEAGEEAMGTNGTWYWRKWASGKAECWGCRNFDNMAVSTAWGNLYRSAVFTEDLPNNVFVRTPDSININFVHTNAGGWISKYDNTAPSAVTTGSFVVVRPVSGNITPTNIGFYIVGEWK